MEVNQSIQNLDNSISLISGKTTYVRLYVSGYRHVVNNVQGFITGNLDGQDLTPAQVQCINATTAYGILNTTTSLRDKWKHSVNCLVPADWLKKPGNLKIAGHVYSRNVVDPNSGNNRMEVALRIDESPALRIKIIQIRDGCLHMECTVKDGPSYADYADLHSLIQRMYPVAEVELIPDMGDWTAWFGEDSTKVNTLDEMWHQHSTVITRTNTFLMGAVRDSVFSAIWGLINWGRGQAIQGTDQHGLGRVSWVEVGSGERAQTLAAHELGHNLRLNHVNACYPGGPYDGYRGYPRLDDGDVRHNYGLDTGTTPPSVVGPRAVHELMTYCRPAWVCERHYRTLLESLQQNIAPPLVQALSSANTRYLLLSGRIKPDTGEVLLLPITRIPAEEMSPYVSGNPPGDYILRVLDKAGVALYEQSFGLTEGNHQQDGAPLFLQIPEQEGMKRLMIEHDGAELFSITASAHAPAVYLHGVSGELASTELVSWTAFDEDGDVLTAAVYFSSDGGKTWRPLAGGLDGYQAEFDTSLWPQTEQGMLRVQVTDGLNTAEDVTGPFTVTAKPPVVFVVSPDDGDLLSPGWPERFTATGYDAEDGSLAGDAFSWTSNRDGELGTGGEIVVTDLSPGWHEITVTVTDSDGQLAADTIEVGVIERQFLPIVLH